MTRYAPRSIRIDLKDTSLVTVFSGADATDADDKRLLKALEERTGGAEISLIKGGQSVYYYIIGVE